MNGISETIVEDVPPGGSRKPDLLVYVYNMVEDEWSFINSVPNETEKGHLVNECEDACDCYYLGMAVEDDFVYISPRSISEQFQNYASKLLDYKNGEVIVPKSNTHQICIDFLNDAAAFTRLINKAQSYGRIILTSYAVSAPFYQLKNKLTDLGFTVYAPEAPSPDCAWTVNFFGSKSGIRQLAQKSAAAEPDFMMPDGVICVGRADAAKIAASKYIRQKGVVIKTNKGSGGNGVLIFRDGELPSNYFECEKAILQQMESEKYWDMFPIVIEDLINVNYGISSGFPNVEFRIHKNGRIEMLYCCATMVTPKGQYYGLDINDEPVNERLTARMIDTGYYIAEQYAAAGYRGHFDVDMVLSRNGQLYVCESNTRNTGGTDVYNVIRKLLGKDFSTDYYVLSRNKLDLPPHRPWTIESVTKILAPLLYSHRLKEGLIVNSENRILDGRLIYTAIGKTKKRAYDLEAQIIPLLNS